MNTTTQPTTTDAAIAQAFRERFNATSMTLEVGLELQNIHNRAAELSTETPATAHGGDLIDTVTAALITASTQHPYGETSGEAWRRLASVAVSLCTPPAGGFVVDEKTPVAFVHHDLNEAPRLVWYSTKMLQNPPPSGTKLYAPTAQPSAKDGVRGERWYATATGQTSEDGKHELYTLTREPFPLSDCWTLIDATTAAGLVGGVRGECVECGTDPETGDIRIIVKTTMEALRDGPPLVYRDVTVSLREAAIGREESGHG